MCYGIICLLFISCRMHTIKDRGSRINDKGDINMNSLLVINDEVYGDLPRDQVEDSLGLLPMWVAEYSINAVEGVTESLVEHMEYCYGFGSLIKFDGEVLDNGNYKSAYEEDEDLPWIGKIHTKDGWAYFYRYAITALPTEDGYFLTRMD